MIGNNGYVNNWNTFNCIIDPACQKINREFQCYVMDRNCSALLNTKEHSDQNNVILNVGIGFVVVLIILVIIITVLCYKQKRTEMNKSKLNNMHKILYFLDLFPFIIAFYIILYHTNDFYTFSKKFCINHKCYYYSSAL